MVLSADPKNDPAPMAIVGAAAALAISEIPFHHLLAGLRVGLIDGQMIPNPSYDEEREATFSIIVAGTARGIVMVEAGGKGVAESQVVDCIEYGHRTCKKIIAGIEELVKLAGKPKRTYEPKPVNDAMYKQIEDLVRADLTDALNTGKYPKLESYKRVADAESARSRAVPRRNAAAEAKQLFDALKERIFRDEMLNNKRRPDGRAFDEIRQIDSKSGCCRARTARRCSRAGRRRRW